MGQSGISTNMDGIFVVLASRLFTHHAPHVKSNAMLREAYMGHTCATNTFLRDRKTLLKSVQRCPKDTSLQYRRRRRYSAASKRFHSWTKVEGSVALSDLCDHGLTAKMYSSSGCIDLRPALMATACVF